MEFDVKLDKITAKRLMQPIGWIVFGIFALVGLYGNTMGMAQFRIDIFIFVFIGVAIVLPFIFGKTKLIVESDRIVFHGLLPIQRYTIPFSQIEKIWHTPHPTLNNVWALLSKRSSLEQQVAQSDMVVVQLIGKSSQIQIRTSHATEAESLISYLKNYTHKVEDISV